MTYICPDSSDYRPTVSVCSGGWCWHCDYTPLIHSQIHRDSCPVSPLWRDCLYQNHFQCCSWGRFCFFSTCYVFYHRYYSNLAVLRRIPGRRLHQTSNSLLDWRWICIFRKIWWGYPISIPAKARVSAYTAWCILPWSDNIGIYSYHPSTLENGYSTKVLPSSAPQISSLPAAKDTLWCFGLFIYLLPRRQS